MPVILCNNRKLSVYFGNLYWTSDLNGPGEYRIFFVGSMINVLGSGQEPLFKYI